MQEIFEIIIPGQRYAPEHLTAFPDTAKLMRNLENIFFEANVALNLFVKSREDGSPLDVTKSREHFTKRRDELMPGIQRAYMQKHNLKAVEGNNVTNDSFTWEHWDEVNIETGRIVRQEMWQAGMLPIGYKSDEVYIHARAFLYALDTFYKTLQKLQAKSDKSAELLVVMQQFQADFPDIIGIRDSAHHSEDRALGLGVVKGKKQAIPNVETVVENGMVALSGVNQDTMIGTKYGNTLADGRYAQIDVSATSMVKLQTILQRIINCFNYTGRKILLPGY